MLFNSYTFLYFLLLVVALRWMAPRRAAPGVLLLASYVFYASWEPLYVVLLAGSTAFAYAIGIAIDRWREQRGQLVAVGVAGTLGVLAWFKYAAFFSAQIDALAGWMWGTRPIGPVEVLLPLGISFFIFQQISYVVDVYRGAPAERSLPAFALYISFFPQLIAGPIVRAGELVPQLKQPPGFDPDQFADGVDLFMRGMLKKVVIADNLAVWSDELFAAPDKFGLLGTWVGVLCYAGQIYGDFSGYTDMARGCAKMMGFELPENFNLPYLSKSITEFWRRWHITLSSWLRDYLYISLGGNRKGKARRYANLMITMGLGGLWHGAAWTFVIWGVYHGTLLILHKAWMYLTDNTFLKAWRSRLAYKVAVGVATFVLVLIGWVVFRATDATSAFVVLRNMFGGASVTLGAETSSELPQAMVRALYFLAALAIGHYIGAAGWTYRLWQRTPAPLRGLGWALALAAVFLFAGRSAEFIYFQF